jgi:hypothetical protein
VIVGASLLLHLAIVLVALLTDVETDNGIAERAYNLTFKQDSYTLDLTPKADASQGSAAGSAAPEKREPDKGPSRPKAPERDGGGKPDVAAMREEAFRFATVMSGEGANGTSEGDMSRRRPGDDLGKEIAEVRESGQNIKIGGGAGRTSRGDGEVRVGTGHGPNISGPTGPESAGGGKVAEKGPSGRISVAEKSTLEESTLTPDAVMSRIQMAYMAGLRRCYKEFLKKDASARGRVTLAFTVNQTGRTVKGAAHGFSAEVDECIGGLMASWTFPKPKDKDGDPTDASFSITLQLVPD